MEEEAPLEGELLEYDVGGGVLAFAALTAEYVEA